MKSSQVEKKLKVINQCNLMMLFKRRARLHTVKPQTTFQKDPYKTVSGVVLTKHPLCIEI